MSWYAVDAIDGALEATRAFLFPFSLGRWARLALITLFLGGGAGVQNVFQYTNSAGQYAGSGTGPGSLSGGSFTPAPLLGDIGPLVPGALAQIDPPVSGAPPFALGFVELLVVAALLLLALLFTVARPVFQFVFVQVIATDDVRVRAPFTRNFWTGIRLLVFQIVVSVLFAIPVAGVAVALFSFGGGAQRLGIAGVVGIAGTVGIAVLILLWALLFALVMGFTRQFVVPVVHVDGSSVLAGWSEVWSLIAGEKKQTLVYLLMHLLVGIGVALLSSLLTLVGLIPVGIVALAVGLAAGAVAGGTVAPNLGIGVGVVAGFAVGLPLYFVLVFLPLNVLTRTYLRTFELASLAGFASRYDVLGHYGEGDGEVGGGGDEPGDDGFGEFVPAENLIGEDTDDDGTASVRDNGTIPAG